MIVFDNVCKTYNIGDTVVKALDHVSFRIEKGEFVAVIGPSGSGKSTCMNIMGCLDVADEGSYSLDGLLIEDYSEIEITKVRSEKIGFVFQSFNLINTLTARENVELPLIYQRVGHAEREKRVDAALESVGLLERGDHLPTQLSGGQQQRVAIARALVTNPSIFLCDEPTGNLDSKTSHEIMDLFYRLNNAGNTIVFITHDNDLAAKAQRAIHILDGKVVA